jgi:hypothetical protein
MSKTTRDILFKGRKLLDDSIKKESREQGHYLTGGLERSLTATVTESADVTVLEGEVAFYANILNEGVRPEKASMKQFPFLVKYWMLRGLDEKAAGGAAAATVKKWMKEGMPTKASSRFSKTGQRKEMLTRAIGKVSKRVDTVIMGDLSKEVDKEFLKTKSETV